ncbi:MAG: FAD binding domain-containing protein [Mycobacterium leprae]
MFLRLQAYHRPQSVAEALKLRQQPNARFIAGGTALAGGVDDATETLIDLSLLDLRYIRQAGEAVALGATTTLADLVSSPEVKAVGGGIIGAVALQTGSLALQTRATLGGILATAGEGEELLAALLALNASVVTVRGASAQVREDWDLATFVNRRHEILDAALIVEVQLPVVAVATAVERVARTPRDLPVVAIVAACRFQGGRVDAVRLAATGLAPLPQRLEAAERICNGTNLTDTVVDRAVTAVQESIAPPDDIRGQADYRRYLARVLVRRALVRLVQASAGTGKE